jgi:hypothetical protein
MTADPRNLICGLLTLVALVAGPIMVVNGQAKVRQSVFSDTPLSNHWHTVGTPLAHRCNTTVLTL